MLKVYLKDLTYPAQEVLDKLLPLYKDLVNAAIKDNDFAMVIKSQYVLSSLLKAQEMVNNPEFYNFYHKEKAYFWKLEDCDDISSLFNELMTPQYLTAFA